MFELTPFRRNNLMPRPTRNLIDIDSLFEGFFNDTTFPTLYNHSNEMKVDIKETDNSYVIDAELPGYDKENVKVEYENDRLTISAEREDVVNEEQENYIRKERRSSSLCRSFRIADVRLDDTSAKFENGILTINLPKLQEVQPTVKNIEIN